MTAEILVEMRDRVAVVTVSNPAMRNAFTVELSQQLAERVDAVSADPGSGAIVVTGAPPAFCAGADLAALADAGEEDAKVELQRIYTGFLAVAACPLPTVAAVNGPAVGAGLNLALACDVRIAGPGARFDARFLKLGIHPGGGMTWMLQRAVGPQTAAAMTLFSQVLGADEAIRTGLAYRGAALDRDPEQEDPTQAHDAVVADAVELAAAAAAPSRELVATVKASMRATATMDSHPDAVRHELVPQSETLRSEEFRQRIRAHRR